MKKILSILIIFSCALTIGATRKQEALRLVRLLEDMRQREEVTPDSFYSDVTLLRQEISRQKDSLSCAVYRATLARLLSCNAYRAQTFCRQTVSDEDSIQEWSQEEYREHAALLYAQALTQADALHNSKAKEWFSLTTRRPSDKAFSNDMLSIVWHAASEDIVSQTKHSNLPEYKDMIAFYRQKGLSEAAMWLTLDSIDAQTPYERTIEELLRVKDEYQERDFCAEVYLRLSERGEQTPEKREAWLLEGIERYPRYARKGALQNALNLLREPMLQWRIKSCFYPGNEGEIVLNVRNMQDARAVLYKLPDNFNEDIENPHKEVVRHTYIATFHHLFKTHPAVEEWKDTLKWKVPETYGLYALLTTAETSAKLDKKPVPQVLFFRVSKLDFYTQKLPNNLLRCTVVDGLSGKPQENVEVSFLSQSNNNELLAIKVTNRNGHSEIKVPEKYKGGISIQLKKGEDRFCKPVRTQHFVQYGTKTDTVSTLNLFTDRAIYRPGQMIHVSAVAYKQHLWDARVREGHQINATYYDANGQTIVTHQLQTDEFGTVHDSLQLPENGLPGNYRVRMGNTYHSIRVEEYRRPTFYVKMDEVQTFTWPTENVTLTGKAIAYDDTPVRNARVTGTYRWSQDIWLRRYYDAYQPMQGTIPDTLYTDNDGSFTITLPVERNEKQIRQGMRLNVQVDVLSPQGETQQGRQWMSLCSTPLRLHANIPQKQDKERIKPWFMELYSSSGKTIEGNVYCTLTKDGKTIYETKFQTGTKVTPEKLETVPSGKYCLTAKAEVNGDTATYTSQIILFSMQDSHLPIDTTLWCYCPCDTFDAKRPAIVQIGSSQDAWMNIVMTSDTTVVLDTIVHYQDSVTQWILPYKKEYGMGTSLSVSLYRNGTLYTQNRQIHLTLPNNTLRPHWETFRDHLQPGQQEVWCLSLQRPDGAPAQANVMLSMYDASLDALMRHNIKLPIYRSHQIQNFSTIGGGLFDGYNYASTQPMLLKMYNTPEIGFGSFNPELIGMFTEAYLTNTRGTRKVAMAKAMVLDAAPMAQSAMNGMAENASITTQETDAVEEKEMEEEEALITKDLRSNLSELAFFMPQLRTSKDGKTIIAFTLPEGLTSWHLTGFAHTKDMMTADIEETIIAQKELTAQLYLPRFLRNGDKASFTASIHNLTNTTQQGNATMQVLDAETGKTLKAEKVRFLLAQQTDTVFTFQIPTAKQHPMLIVRWMAKGKDFSDGEQRYLPVLSDMQSITETKAFSIDGAQKWEVNLKKLFSNNSQAATNKRLTIEYTARPVWIALQALPSLSQPTHQDALSLTSAYYACSLTSYIASQVPDMKETVKKWSQNSTPAKGFLQDNESLTGILLQETPWAVEGQRENERLQRLKSLFQHDRQESIKMNLLHSIQELQHTDGSISWFPGMDGSRYITTEIVNLLTRLQHATSKTAPDAAMIYSSNILTHARNYLAKEITQEIKNIKKQNESSISSFALRWLYIHFLSRENTNNEQATYLINLLVKQAKKQEGENRALSAIVLKMAGEEKLAKELMKKFRTLLTHPDGYYLAYPSGSFTGIDRKVQTHVQIMEAFQTVQPKDTALLHGMQKWLLEQKRTQEWEQPMQTADALYILLQDNLQNIQERNNDILMLNDSGKKLTVTSPESEAGYIREVIQEAKSPQNLSIEKRSNGLSWGAIYAQYQLPFSQIEAEQEGLNIHRDIEQKETKVGDRVHVRYTISADKDYEYVCLHAGRIGASEPNEQISGYRYQNGIGYYQAMHDASTEYFFDRLPHGTYVLEEDWLLTHAGTYQIGSATLQCLYAPEYQAHASNSHLTVTP